MFYAWHVTHVCAHSVICYAKQAGPDTGLDRLYTMSAMRSQWNRALGQYQQIKQLTGITGGAGNSDILDPLGLYERRIIAARGQGKAVGELTASVVKEWIDQGWLDLFNSRYLSSF